MFLIVVARSDCLRCVYMLACSPLDFAKPNKFMKTQSVDKVWYFFLGEIHSEVQQFNECVCVNATVWVDFKVCVCFRLWWQQPTRVRNKPLVHQLLHQQRIAPSVSSALVCILFKYQIRDFAQNIYNMHWCGAVQFTRSYLALILKRRLLLFSIFDVRQQQSAVDRDSQRRGTHWSYNYIVLSKERATPKSEHIVLYIYFGVLN